MEKIDTKVNPADLLTKHLNSETRSAHISRLCMEIKFGKADAGKNLHSVEGKVKPVNSNPSDEWIARGENGIWERKHHKPRQALFTPMKVTGGPIEARTWDSIE